MPTYEHIFAFGSCRMRFMECPYCETVLSSLTQINYWLDVNEGKCDAPCSKKLKNFMCFEQADTEPWYYDFSNTRSFIIEICTLKTLWHNNRYPISLLYHYRKGPVEYTQLEVATPDELYSQMQQLRERLADKFIVFVCQQTYKSDNFSLYYLTEKTRHVVRDLNARAAREMSNCATYDPTARIAEFGPERCLLDVHHWTPFSGQVFAHDIHNLIPEGYK